MSTEIAYSLVPNRTDVLVFDAATSASADSASEVTSDPVESGGDVTDNVRALPRTLDLDVTVTDYPLSTAGNGINAATTETSGIGTSPTPGRAEAILSELYAIKDAAVLCAVSCGSRYYSDMVIKSVSVPKTKPLVGAIRFKVKLVEVRIVASEVVPLAKVSAGKARPTKSAGHQEGTEAQDAAKKKSFAKRFSNWVTH